MTSNVYDETRAVRAGARSLYRFVIAGVVLAILAVAPAIADANRPATSDLAALFSTLEKTYAITEGASSPKGVLYVFFDANCWYCHLTWKALQPYERVGLQVRWVPVAYQKESSAGRAAAIMQARDRAAALRENEVGYRVQKYEGGIAPAAGPPAALLAQLEANTKLMERFGAPGTPALVWKDSAGSVQVKIGMPRLSQLPAITGLHEQKNDDPELAEFR